MASTLSYEKKDRYGAIWFTEDNFQLAADEFTKRLHASIQKFNADFEQETKNSKTPPRRRAFWFDIPNGVSSPYISAVSDAGFRAYCVSPTKTRYLFPNGASVPTTGTSSSGVNVLITRLAQGELQVLMVLGHRDAYLRLPGGNVDPGETTISAAIREIKEELGVGSRVIKLVAIEERVKGLSFDNDDIQTAHFLYFFEVDIDDGPLAVQESEIKAVRWVNVDMACDADAEFLTAYFGGGSGNHKVNLLTQAILRRSYPKVPPKREKYAETNNRLIHWAI